MFSVDSPGIKVNHTVLYQHTLKKGDREDSPNYRATTLLSVVGKVFCKIFNNKLVQCLDKKGELQGKLREDFLKCFLLHIQKAYDSGWCDGLWYKLWDMGENKKLWHAIKKIYDFPETAVPLVGEILDAFKVQQGVAQGCNLCHIIFSIQYNRLKLRFS